MSFQDENMHTDLGDSPPPNELLDTVARRQGIQGEVRRQGRTKTIRELKVRYMLVLHTCSLHVHAHASRYTTLRGSKKSYRMKLFSIYVCIHHVPTEPHSIGSLV